MHFTTALVITYSPFVVSIYKQHRAYFPQFSGCSIHPDLVKLTCIYMDEEHPADFHPFLVIICAHQMLVAQHTLSWLKLTCIHMDEEHRADYHPFLVICNGY